MSQVQPAGGEGGIRRGSRDLLGHYRWVDGVSRLTLSKQVTSLLNVPIHAHGLKRGLYLI